MPVVCDFEVKVLPEDEFHAINRIVMRHAFDIQNELGGFCDEKVDQNELVFRLKSQNISAVSEALVKVVHQDFVKYENVANC